MVDFPINSTDPRLPKKQRRRDENPPDLPGAIGNGFPSLMECEGQFETQPIISYKDVVSCPLGSRSSGSSVNLDDDEIELLEDDIALGVSDGIPTIDFSDQVQQLAIKSMDLTLFVKVLGCRIGYNNLHNRIYSIWKHVHPLKLIDTEYDYFLVKFSDRSDYLKLAPLASNSIPDEPFEPWMLVERTKRNSRVSNPAIQVTREDRPHRSQLNPTFVPSIADFKPHPDGVNPVIEAQIDTIMAAPVVPNQSDIILTSSEAPIQRSAKVNGKRKQFGISKNGTALTLTSKKICHYWPYGPEIATCILHACHAKPTYFGIRFKDDTVLGAYPLLGHFPRLSEDAVRGLDRIPDPEEIREALFAMAPLKSPGPLISWKLNTTAVNADTLVCDMVLPDGTWNWVLLKQLVHPSVIPHLLNIPPPDSFVGRDRPTWPRRYMPNFFTLQADEWLLSNLNLNRLHSGTHFPWRILFASLVWKLWKRRNSVLFANTDLPNDVLLWLSYSWAFHFTSSASVQVPSAPPVREIVQWSGAG
ncbi:hypothetical protein V6N12_049797 [Hibiscus sabdariffa]|uniref:DUF4283 domain-containing protein n=1 Tax=Hibiscus sabdariffa TaxID=183260 RepID=A0ABR2GAJ8_9ROSI